MGDDRLAAGHVRVCRLDGPIRTEPRFGETVSPDRMSALVTAPVDGRRSRAAPSDIGRDESGLGAFNDAGGGSVEFDR